MCEHASVESCSRADLVPLAAHGLPARVPRVDPIPCHRQTSMPSYAVVTLLSLCNRQERRYDQLLCSRITTPMQRGRCSVADTLYDMGRYERTQARAAGADHPRLNWGDAHPPAHRHVAQQPWAAVVSPGSSLKTLYSTSGQWLSVIAWGRFP
jgi:hypothetical protein